MSKKHKSCLHKKKKTDRLSPKQLIELKNKYMYVSTLKERNWTAGAIKRFLGEPDLEIPNPCYFSKTKSHLYGIDRVLTAEQCDEFKAWQEKTVARRQKMSKRMMTINDKKREKMIEYVNELKIDVPVMPEHVLFRQATKHYNKLQRQHGYSGFRSHSASMSSNREFLKRISVNMLRHKCTIYEKELDAMFGKIGKFEGHDLLKGKVNDVILKTYPSLELKDDWYW